MERYSGRRFYIDRILKGARPRSRGTGNDSIRTGNQLKTAKSLGLDIPPTLFARADKVIEQGETLAFIT